MNLSETQKSVLTTAAARPSGEIQPIERNMPPGAVLKVIAALEKRGLIVDISLKPPYKDWRISDDGYRAIGLEPPLAEQTTQDAMSSIEEKDADPFLGIPDDADVDFSRIARKHFDAISSRESWSMIRDAFEEIYTMGFKAARKRMSGSRTNTKQARMIEMMKRPGGTTIEQIAQETGWSPNTIRGAISGGLKKRLGLEIHTQRTSYVGPNAKGGYTTYKIIGK